MLQGAALNRDWRDQSMLGLSIRNIRPFFCIIMKPNGNYEVPKCNRTVVNPLISWRMSIVVNKTISATNKNIHVFVRKIKFDYECGYVQITYL